MRGLYHYLPPFAPDDSGAVSVLYELGGLVVVMDAGGCTGNICGFDEPRWHTKESALYSAGIRDIDAIMGRDDRLISKIGNALRTVSCRFIALIGTPVPSVIGTDYAGLKHLLEKRYGLPVLTVDTTGMEYYDRGEEKAYKSLLAEILKRNTGNGTGKTAPGEGSSVTGIWGATPLDFPGEDPEAFLCELMPELSGKMLRCYGYGCGIPDNLADAERNIAVSPAGLKAVSVLKEKFGTEFSVLGGSRPVRKEQEEHAETPSLLIVHQQMIANAIRKRLEGKGFAGRIDVASFFMLEPDYAEKNDVPLEGEGDISKLVSERGYQTVAGDPQLLNAMPEFPGRFVELPHYAVSGDLCGPDELLKGIKRLENGND